MTPITIPAPVGHTPSAGCPRCGAGHKATVAGWAVYRCGSTLEPLHPEPCDRLWVECSEPERAGLTEGADRDVEGDHAA